MSKHSNDLKEEIRQERRRVRKTLAGNTEACNAYFLPFLISIIFGIEWPLTVELWPLQVWYWSAGLPSTMTTSSKLFLLVTTESASPASFEGAWRTIVTQVTLTLSSRKCVYWDVAARLSVSYGLYSTQPQEHCPKGEGLYQPSSMWLWYCMCVGACTLLGSNSGHILSKSIFVIQDDERHWCVYKSPVK